MPDCRLQLAAIHTEAFGYVDQDLIGITGAAQGVDVLLVGDSHPGIGSQLIQHLVKEHVLVLDGCAGGFWIGWTPKADLHQNLNGLLAHHELALLHGVLVPGQGIDPSHIDLAVRRSTAPGHGALERVTDRENDQHKEHQSQDEVVHQLALLLGHDHQVVVVICGRGSGVLVGLLGSHPKSRQAQLPNPKGLG